MNIQIYITEARVGHEIIAVSPQVEITVNVDENLDTKKLSALCKEITEIIDKRANEAIIRGGEL